MAERYTDILDQAANVTAEAAARSIAHISAQAKQLDTSNPGGKCWYCGDEIGNGRRWCSADCRDDWVSENDR